MTEQPANEPSGRGSWRAAFAARYGGMRLGVGLAFALYLVLGLAIYDDYGATWDEPLNRDPGQRTFSYVVARASGTPVEWKAVSRGLLAEQGPFFETTLSALEAVLQPKDSRAVRLMRHLATILFFWFGTVAFYVLLHRWFGERWLALTGVALLVVTPRLFAHSFYNSKDAVLTSLFMIGMATMLWFVRERSPASIVRMHWFVPRPSVSGSSGSSCLS